VFELDYGTAVVLGTIGLGPALNAWRRALWADSALQHQYQETRTSTVAAITGSHVIPLVARIVADIHPRIAWPILAKPGPEHVEQIESQLQSVGFGSQLDRISPLAADIEQCQRLQDEVKRRLWGQAWAALVYMPCAGFFIVKLSSEGMDVPHWLYWFAAIIGASALSVAFVFGGLEIGSRKRMAMIFRSYE
jgi:hypothetical protein